MRDIKFRVWERHSITDNFQLKPLGNVSLLFVTDNERFPNRTIMQYTGLKDPNKVEIYHKDIVKFLSPILGEGLITGTIEYWNGAFWVSTDFNEEKFDYGIAEPITMNVWVIGNVYEHPHLLNA